MIPCGTMNKKLIGIVFIVLILLTSIPLAGAISHSIATVDKQEDAFQLYLGRIDNPEEKWIGSEWTFELTFNAVSLFYISEKPPFFQWLRNGETISIIIGVGGFKGLVGERFICVLRY